MSPGEARFRALYRAHAPQLWRTIRRLGVPESSVGDVIQEVFFVLSRRLPELTDTAQLSPWLYATAVNTVRHYHRTVRRKIPEQDPARMGPDAETLLDPGHNPEKATERAEALDKLYEALDRLEGPAREVLVLADLDKLTVPQIAHILEENVNTVYSRLGKARTEFDKIVRRILVTRGHP